MAEAARLAGMTVAGVYDDDERCTAAREPDGAEWLGPLSQAGELERPWVLCLGDLATRARVLGRLPGVQSVTVSHPGAICSASAAVGRGVFVGPRAVVHSRATIADHAIINTGAIVEHDCQIGVNAHLAPGSVLGGAAGVGPGTLIGLGAVVLPGVRVGAGCVVGAGAVVREDVPDGCTVAGVPARRIR